MSVASGLHIVAEHTLCVGVICDREVGGFHVNPLRALGGDVRAVWRRTTRQRRSKQVKLRFCFNSLW